MAGNVFSTTLQKLRKERGVTQEQLATHLGVSPQAVSKWENGSYPDGDLLPQLAVFFGVSIDFLYGREKEHVSLEQQLLEEIKKLGASTDYEEHFDHILRYIWAMQIGFWQENNSYYDRLRPTSDLITASTVIENAGFTFFRLNQDLEFYTIMKRPKEGFASYFKVTDKLVDLFAFLGRKDNLKILFYLLSLRADEGVSLSTIARRTGTDMETATAAMEYLKSLAADNQGNKIVQEVSVLNELDKTEPLYTICSTTSGSLLLLLAGADTVLHPPASFALSVYGATRAWFERDKLEFLPNTKDIAHASGNERRKA